MPYFFQKQPPILTIGGTEKRERETNNEFLNSPVQVQAHFSQIILTYDQR